MAGGVRLSADPGRGTRGLAAWLAVGLLLAVPALLFAASPGDLLAWDRARLGLEPWRLWSASWVHYSPSHLALNLGGTVLVVALGVQARVPVRAAAAWALAWPLTHAALLLRPQLAHYAGLSGVLHAGVAVVAVELLRAAEPRERRLGGLLLLGLLVKVASEAPWAAVLPYSQALGIRVVPFAHAAGLAAGVLCALMLCRIGADERHE